MSVALGLVAGAAIAGSRLVDRLLTPWLVVAHAIPKVVIAPAVPGVVRLRPAKRDVLRRGLHLLSGDREHRDGLKSADPEQLLMVRAMGASRLQVLHKIQFPNALPSICAGIKLAVSLAPVGAVIGEFVASNAGLGHLLIRAVGDTRRPRSPSPRSRSSRSSACCCGAPPNGSSASVLPWHPSQRETLMLRDATTWRRNP